MQGVDAGKCSFEFTDVAINSGGQKGRDVFAELEPVQFGFLVNNGNPGFELWWLNTGDKARSKSADEPLLQLGNIRRCRVGGQYNLLARLMQGIECVKELFLDLLTSSKFLDVINQ